MKAEIKEVQIGWGGMDARYAKGMEFLCSVTDDMWRMSRRRSQHSSMSMAWMAECVVLPLPYIVTLRRKTACSKESNVKCRHLELELSMEICTHYLMRWSIFRDS